MPPTLKKNRSLITMLDVVDGDLAPKPEHTATRHVFTIWIPDSSGIQMPTVSSVKNIFKIFVECVWNRLEAMPTAAAAAAIWSSHFEDSITDQLHKLSFELQAVRLTCVSSLQMSNQQLTIPILRPRAMVTAQWWDSSSAIALKLTFKGTSFNKWRS